MRRIKIIMGMPVQVEVADRKPDVGNDIDKVFEYFRYVDENYSPFKKNSEVAKLNKGKKVTSEMAMIISLCEKTKNETGGYFNIVRPDGKIDPSGIVKGWAIKNAADILRNAGYKKFFVDAGGDAEIVGKNWKWGVRNPFNTLDGPIVKVLNLSDCGIATSGTYERGQHIYNPITKKTEITDIVSITVIGPNVYEADRFATAAFAMGKSGIGLIASRKELAGYMIDSDMRAIRTSNFEAYTSLPI